MFIIYERAGMDFRNIINETNMDWPIIVSVLDMNGAKNNYKVFDIFELMDIVLDNGDLVLYSVGEQLDFRMSKNFPGIFYGAVMDELLPENFPLKLDTIMYSVAESLYYYENLNNSIKELMTEVNIFYDEYSTNYILDLLQSKALLPDFTPY
ncbi:hypothetical protein [Woodsholea maritima]|uniref:hypothetical protein n=1 Tax=Woodsholea maritima TaxID=240237 RepID=UPI000362C61C|nr:hypothetical protein [Woodsholea maritima]